MHEACSVRADNQAEIERVEKLVAKMEKKNKGDDEINEDALADADEQAEEGGAKEPNHSESVFSYRSFR